MSKETPVLVAKKRDKLGTRYSRRLRAAGQLPANLYGHGSQPMPIGLTTPTPVITMSCGCCMG